MTNQINNKIELPQLKGIFDDGEWRKHAKCADTNDFNIFFAESRGGGNAYFEARCICYTCPVQKECLDFAVDNSIYAGIWGGLPYRERLRYMKKERSHIITIYELMKGMRNKNGVKMLADKIGVTEDFIRKEIKKGRYKYDNR